MPASTQASTAPRVKAIPFSPIGVTPADGLIEAVAAVTGNVDLDREMFGDDAFDDTILQSKTNFMRIPMGADHDAALGVTLDMERISRGDLPKKARDAAPDATGGLFCKGQVVMMPAQVRILEAIQARVKAGDPPGSSVTFYSDPAAEETIRVKGADVTVFGKASVVEWGPALRKRARNPGAAVLSAKSKEEGAAEKAAAYLAGTYEERRARVQEAIGASGIFEGRDWYIEGTAPDYVVVVIWSEGSTLYTVVYYAEVNGVIVLGDSRPADVTLTLTVKAAGDAGADETFTIEKAGRVLRRTLLERLDRAMEELDAIRVAAKREEEEEGDEGDTEGKGEKSGPVGDPDAEAELELDLSFLNLEADALGLQ